MIKAKAHAAIVLLLLNLGAEPRPPLSQSRLTDGKNKKFLKQTLDLNGEEITIVRDKFGVPHVFAKTRRGLYYGGGYAVAQDRLYQLERYRRDVRGNLAEIEGPQAFQRDVQMRQLGYSEEVFKNVLDKLPDDIKQSYAAYTDGINRHIEEVISQNRVPKQFLQAGMSEPSAWRVTDSIAIGVLTARRFGSLGGTELTNARILQSLKRKFGNQADNVFNDLFWLNDPRSPSTIHGQAKQGATINNRSNSQWATINLTDEALAQVNRSVQQMDVLEYAMNQDLPTGWGSICWVIGPLMSASNNAVLVGNPQMGYSNPATAHEIHYSSGELNVIGMGLAGIPGVIVGHNDHLAWSMTSGTSDMRDIFIEKLNPRNKTQYFYKGKYRDMEKRIETIKIKGEQPRQVELYETVHGPVVGWDIPPGGQPVAAYALAASYVGHESSTFEALYRFNYAKDINECAKLLEPVYTNHNFLVATVDGDIGYWHCGRLPLRAPGHDVRLPVMGTGEYDWKGTLPFSQMPQVINPKQGYLVSFNNKPAPWWLNGDTAFWGGAQYLGSLKSYIETHAPMTFEQIRDISQYAATIDGNAVSLKPHLLTALKKTGAARSSARIREAESYLHAWDNHKVDGSVAKTIFDAWIDALREVVFDDEFGDLKSITSPVTTGPRFFYPALLSVNFISHVLDGAASGVPPSRDYFNGKNKDGVIVEALIKAIEKLTDRLGPQMNLWAYSQGWIDFNPLSGIPQTNRGTYIHAVEMSKPLFRSISILPPGQSDDPSSPHFGDQREMAGYWRYKELLYKPSQIMKALDLEN